MSKLKLIAGIILLAIIIFLIRNIIVGEPPFKEMDLSFSTNTIQNYSSVAYLDTISHVGIHELEIDSVSVVLLDIPSHIIHEIMVGDQVNGFVLQVTDSLYQIYINPKLSRRQHINIIAHELIHVEQNISHRLIMLDSPFVFWKEDSLDVSVIDYKNREWEIEAYQNERTLESQIKESLY